MKQKIFHLCLSAFLYWIVATYAGTIFVIPPKMITISTFIPPILGLMWGSLAAVGVYLGGLFATPEIYDLISSKSNIADWLIYFVRGFWVFLAGYLPYFLWHKWNIDLGKSKFSLKVETLKKFLITLLITFAVTSIFRTLTASSAELETVAGLMNLGKSMSVPLYFIACFINDFFVSLFFDLALFFFLIIKNYPFYNPAEEIDKPSNLQDDNQLTGEESKALIISLRCYFLFPAVVAYLDIYQIYGMDHIETWLNFIIECLAMIDVYLVLMLYLLLRYRRSIMMEIVFLVAMTVFLSSAVLGWGSSVAMGHLVKSHTDDSLHAMSVICRERLERTFFCVRQAVNGMERQAINTIESYDRLKNDADYRKEYLSGMEKRFDDIARGTDGCITYYLHLSPEFGGSKSGFFMAREDARWEGALSGFIEREVTDLSLFSPDDKQRVGWYYIPYKYKCATWIEPYIDPTTNSYVISYVAPLFIEKNFIGVIGIEIDFNFIIQELRRMSIYDYGYVYIMNRNNIILYHNDRFQGSIFQSNPEFQEIELYLTNGMWLGIATPLSKVHDERNKILMHLVAAILIVAMIISIVSIALASRAIHPLAGMTEAAKRIASGDLNVKISYESGNELGLLVRSIREMAAKLEIYVYRDKLTGLRNAAAYISKGSELDTQRHLTPDFNYGVIIFDVNFLKKVNDQHGHEAGNELLRHASKVICKVFEHSPVYRVGGDEFAAILEQQDYENRKELLDLFDEKIAEESFEIAGDTIRVSVARGLGIYESEMDFAAVAKRADVAMYNHKSAIKAKYGEEVR